MMLQKITLREKRKIESLRKASGHELSVHAFASLYLWQEPLGLSLYIDERMFCVKSAWYGCNAWYFPCGEEQEVRDFISKRMQKKDFELVCLRSEDVLWMQREYPEGWSYIPDEAGDEYIYSIREHMELKGRAYADMRTQVHKAEREYRLKIYPLDSMNEEDAIYILREWRCKKGKVADGALSDDQVNETLIRMRKELSGEGIVVYMDGMPVSVVAGVPLSKDSFDIIVAKSTKNIQGISYYAKHAMMRNIRDRFQYINLEDDMGIEGLRAMKTAMRPVRKNIVWRAVQNNEKTGS